jgi:hypothetical protein
MPAYTFRLLFLVLLGCAVCLQAQIIKIPHVFLHANGTIPQNGQVLVVQNSFDVTTYPGPTTFTINAGFSVYVCVTAYAAVSFNLSQNCPATSLLSFDYNNGTSADPFELFLNDYSFSFRGRSKLLEKPSRNGAQPFTNLNGNLTLFQNLQYYIAIEFQDISAKNTTETSFRLTVSTTEKPCGPNTIPSGLPPPALECEPINPIGLNATILSFSYNVKKGDSQLFQIEIGLNGFIVPQFVIEVISESGINDLEILFSYNQYPTKTNAQYTLKTFGNFLAAPPPTNFTQNFTSPLPGIYYALLSSEVSEARAVTVTLTEPNCTISETGTGVETCINFEYQTIASQTKELTFTNETMYFAVPPASALQFGVVTDEVTSPDVFLSFFGNVGFNFFPTNSTFSTGLVPTYQSQNGQLFFAFNNTAGILTTYIVGITGPGGASFTVWEGSQCPFNCNGHGSCGLDLTCTCDGYNGDYCQNKNKKLSTLYIILIIIGGAIVLAVLIGVPVALYLNNRKRARYERV